MNTEGLHSLVDPFADDVKAICCLLNYAEQLRTNKHFYDNSEEFLSNTNTFLKCLLQYYGTSKSHSVSNWMSYLRHLLLIVSETVYIKSNCDVCCVAIETVITVPAKVRRQLRDLNIRLGNVCSSIVMLQRVASSICDVQQQGSLNANDEEGVVCVEDLIAMVMRSKQIQDLLEGCEVLLSSVVKVMEEKCSREKKFFNSLSLTIGAACAGNLAWNLWQGRTPEQLMSTGLWTVCTGLSAVVLQIPRVRVSGVTCQLEHHRKEREKIRHITKDWLDVDILSYGKLARQTSKRPNGFMVGKVTEVTTNCR